MKTLFYDDRELVLGVSLKTLSKAISLKARVDGYLDHDERYEVKDIEYSSKDNYILSGMVQKIVKH